MGDEIKKQIYHKKENTNTEFKERCSLQTATSISVISVYSSKLLSAQSYSK